jgi:selenoprotein W-related protein
VSLTAELLKAYEAHITALTLVPSAGGVFEVEADGELIFSKQATQRFPSVAEVKQALKAKLPE